MKNNAESTRSELNALLHSALETSPIIVADRKRAARLVAILKPIAEEGKAFELLDALGFEMKEAKRALSAARKGRADWNKAVDQIDPALELDEEEYLDQMGAVELVFGSGWALVEDLAAARLDLAKRWIEEVTAAIADRLSARMSAGARS